MPGTRAYTARARLFEATLAVGVVLAPVLAGRPFYLLLQHRVIDRPEAIASAVAAAITASITASGLILVTVGAILAITMSSVIFTARVGGGASPMGAHGRRVERPDDLRPMLEETLALGAPALVDVAIQNKVR